MFKLEMGGNKSGTSIPQPGFPWIAAVAASCVTFLVFIHVAGADFVFWDDDICIYNNPGMGPLSLDRLKWILTDVDSTMRYIPLTLLSWCATYSLAKLSPFAYHLGNLVFHSVNTGLLLWVLLKLLKERLSMGRPSTNRRFIPTQTQITWAATMGALVWALHPLRVEPVAWATARSYNQAVFFLLLSLGFYLNAFQAASERRRYLLAVSVSCFGCSLLSHPIGWSYFLVLSVLDAYPLQRLGGRSDGRRWPHLRPVLLEKLPFAVVALGVGTVNILVRFLSAGIWDKPLGLTEFSLLERIMQAFYVWAYYLWRPWYPADLVPAYSTLIFFNPLQAWFLISAAAVIVITVMLVLFRRRWPLGLTLWVCHLLLLIPVLGLSEHPHFTCDRYALVQGIVWAALVAASLAMVPASGLITKRLILGLSVMILVGLAAMSIRQTRVWENSTALFEHMIRVLPGNHLLVGDMHRRLGQVQIRADRFVEACASWNRALQINPDDYMTHSMLGAVLAQRGMYRDSLPHMQQLARLTPNSAPARMQLGAVLAELGHLDLARRELEQGLQLDPKDQRIADLLLKVVRAQGSVPGR